MPIFNTIFIAAGITNQVDLNMPKSTIYGALGFVIGHEFSHGFDNTGANYDEDGKVRGMFKHHLLMHS
jgi:putative endopeptidase